MKKIKNENFIAGCALVVLLLLFCTFLFAGTTVWSIVATLIVVGAGIIAALVWRIANRGLKSIGKMCRYAAWVITAAAIVMIPRLVYADDVGNSGSYTLGNGVKFTYITSSGTCSADFDSENVIKVTAAAKENGCNSYAKGEITLSMQTTVPNVWITYCKSTDGKTYGESQTELVPTDQAKQIASATTEAKEGSTASVYVKIERVWVQTTEIAVVSPFYDAHTAAGGDFSASVTIGSTTYTSTYGMAQSDFVSGDSFTYASPTAPDDYVFLGWSARAATGEFLLFSSPGTHSLTVGKQWYISPVLIPSGEYNSGDYNATGAFRVGSTSYFFLDEAIAVAKASYTGTDVNVVVTKDCSATLANGNTVTIPDGVTLLIPYSPDSLTIDSSTNITEDNHNSTWKYANKQFVVPSKHDASLAIKIADKLLLPDVEVTYELTVPNGVVLNVSSQGKLVIGGTIAAGHKDYVGITGGTAGPHSNVILQDGSEIKVANEGVLSCCGYILSEDTDGNGEKTGKVVVQSGGTIYQPFVILDHRNGPFVIAARDDDLFPFNRYSVMNVQSDLRMNYGSSMIGYADLFTDAVSVLKMRHNVCELRLIGTAENNALINLTKDSYLDISYDSERHLTDTYENDNLYYRVGTTTLNFYGGASVGFMSMDLEVMTIKASVSTKDNYFPVPFNFKINLTNGEYIISYPVKLLPGAEMTVDQTAELEVTSKLAIMAGVADHSVPSASVSMKDDKYVLGVYHYPTCEVLKQSPLNSNGTANLFVNGTLTVTGALGGIVQTKGTGTIIMNGATSVSVGVGSPNITEVKALGFYSIATDVTGKTEYSLDAELLSSVDGKTFKMKANSTYVGTAAGEYTIEGFKYKLYPTSTTNTPVDQDGEMNATVKGSWTCKGEHTYEKTATTATCTTNGEATFTCHCGNSKQEFEAALGHTEVVDAAVAPTCTGTGLTEGKHCSVCEAVIVAQTVIPAKGHTAGAAPTCTTAQICAECSVELAPALGHTPGAAATCTTAQTCTVCGAELQAALGHKWSAWSIDNATHTCTSACGNDSGHKISVLLEYRMNDYIWLNATVTSAAGKPGCSDASIAYEQYLIKKVLSNHITDSVKVSFTLNGTTPELEIGFLEYAKLLSADANTSDATVKLLASMLMYGEASEDYFGNGGDTTGNDNGTILTAYQTNLLNNNAIPERLKTALRACVLSGHSADKDLLQPADTNANYGEKGLENGLTISTTGAAFYFDEALRLSVGYKFAKDATVNANGTITFGDTTYTVLQVGLLVQELEELDGKWTMCDVLYAENGVTAYIAYDNSASLESGRVDEEGNQENHPDVGPGGPDAFVNTLGASGEINFDLLVKEYNKGFALRTYAVLEANETQYVIYGKQYGYGLEAYVKATYGDDAAFNPLLATAWGYAQAAVARYPEVK